MKNSTISRRGLLIGVCVVMLGLFLGPVALAVDNDELASAGQVAPNVPPAPELPQVPPLYDLLLVGTSQNSTVPTNTLNDVFTIDPATNTSSSVLTGVQVWGAEKGGYVFKRIR